MGRRSQQAFRPDSALNPDALRPPVGLSVGIRNILISLSLRLSAVVLLLGAVVSPGQAQETASAPRQGPEGWEGWFIVNDRFPGHEGESLPVALILAHQGRVVRRIEGAPFIWKWMFMDEGRQVAYLTAALHFSARCILLDTGTGKELANYDCEQDQTRDSPNWLRQLNQAR